MEMSLTRSGQTTDMSSPTERKAYVDVNEETVPVEVAYDDDENVASTRFSFKRLMIFAGSFSPTLVTYQFVMRETQ